MSDTDSDAVRAALAAFQQGYTERDVQTLSEFMQLFAPDEPVDVIGTSAITPTDAEWCIGHDATRTLIEADWKDWGDLVLDVEGATIHLQDDIAWLSTSGTVRQTLPLEHAYSGMATFLQNFLERRTSASESPNTNDIEGELLNVILGAASALSNHRHGEHHIWPIRFTAVLARFADGWKFRQMHFSYPIVHLPQVRWS